MPQSMERAIACHKIIKNHLVLTVSCFFLFFFVFNYKIIKRSLNNLWKKKDFKHK